MKRYPAQRPGPDTGPGRSLSLLAKEARDGDIVLDLGCGRAPLGEQVGELELHYVAVDVDTDALAEVAERGFETHRLDLSADAESLTAALAEIVSQRRLAGVMAVDVLEHLIAPDAILRAVRALAGGGEEDWPLIVSVPNVTHIDIAAKLLLGRWDLTEFGLLDDTHLRFFSERLLLDLFRETGWRQDETADVTTAGGDQLFPIDAPLVRPGAPGRELLRDLSQRAHETWHTYQFVRSFVPAAVPSGQYSWAVDRESDENKVFASVLVRSDSGDGRLESLLDDLDAQTMREFETIVIGSDVGVGDCATVVQAPPGADAWNAGIDAAAGRYLCFLEDGMRVSSHWLETFRQARKWVGNVLKVNAVSIPASRLGERGAVDDAVESGTAFQVNPLDLLHHSRVGPAPLSAYAVPLQTARAAGVRFEPQHGTAAAAVFLTRAAQLSGVVPLDNATVAVSDEIQRDGETDMAVVANALDAAPLILPPGSASRVIGLRRALAMTQSSVSWRVTKPIRGAKRLVQRRRGVAPRGG